MLISDFTAHLKHLTCTALTYENGENARKSIIALWRLQIKLITSSSAKVYSTRLKNLQENIAPIFYSYSESNEGMFGASLFKPCEIDRSKKRVKLMGSR